jgi:hypothetical protein
MEDSIKTEQPALISSLPKKDTSHWWNLPGEAMQGEAVLSTVWCESVKVME